MCRLIQTILVLIFFVGCAEDFTGGSRFLDTSQAEESPDAPKPIFFNTRLNNSLLISGLKCRGDETTESYGNGANCLANEYLVTIDEVNICDEDGRCTESIVIPIVAQLINTNAGLDGYAIFNIEAISSASDRQLKVLSSVFIVSDINGNGVVKLGRDLNR